MQNGILLANTALTAFSGNAGNNSSYILFSLPGLLAEDWSQNKRKGKDAKTTWDNCINEGIEHLLPKKFMSTRKHNLNEHTEQTRLSYYGTEPCDVINSSHPRNTLIIFYKNNFRRTWGSENFLD